MNLDPYLCNFVRPKTWDKLSVIIDHVRCALYNNTFKGIVYFYAGLENGNKKESR